MYIKMAKKIRRKEEKEIIREIEIPEDIEVKIENNEVDIKSGGKEIKRRFSHVIIEKKDNKIIIKTKKATKREKKQINAIASHIKNMLKGIKETFVYKLQICSVHFPMNVAVKGEEVIVKNFLGETKERKAKILRDVEVKIDGAIITVKASDKEAAGQTAANIEKVATSRNKDRRIFQDGIFMIEKSGEEI